jgi:hypothetical protein
MVSTPGNKQTLTIYGGKTASHYVAAYRSIPWYSRRERTAALALGY